VISEGIGHLHELARGQRDRLSREALKTTVTHLRDDARTRRHALTFARRGVSFPSES
jgi:hypothetical protein